MMTTDEYQQWSSDPLTVKFHQFLADYRLSLSERWAQGEFPGEVQNAQQIGRAMMLADLRNLADDAISEFYRQPTKEESEKE